MNSLPPFKATLLMTCNLPELYIITPYPTIALFAAFVKTHAAALYTDLDSDIVHISVYVFAERERLLSIIEK